MLPDLSARVASGHSPNTDGLALLMVRVQLFALETRAGCWGRVMARQPLFNGCLAVVDVVSSHDGILKQVLRN